MTRHFGAWTIDVQEIEHWSFGRGFHATAYIAKTNGTKASIREFYRYDGIKNHKQMLEYTQKLLEI